MASAPCRGVVRHLKREVMYAMIQSSIMWGYYVTRSQIQYFERGGLDVPHDGEVAAKGRLTKGDIRPSCADQTSSNY